MCVLWIALGIAAGAAEIFLMALNSRFELFTGTVVLLMASALWFWVICKTRRENDNRNKKKLFYFVKSVLCMSVGRFILYGTAYFFVGHEGRKIIVFWAVMTTLLMICMGLEQWIYDRLVIKEVYFGYILIGSLLAVNAAYILRIHDSISWREANPECVYMLEHGALLFLAVVSALYRYRRYHKIRIKENEITAREYICHAIKMTFVSFILFIGPVYALFLAE